MPTLIERGTGKRVQVDGDQAHDAVLSGKYGFETGSRVPVVQADGTIGTVSSKDAAKALQQGLRLASDEQYRGAQYAAKYENSPLSAALHTATAAGQGALRAVTLGASDAAQIELGRLTGGESGATFARDFLVGQKSEHPYAEGAGQVAGFVAPALLSGGSSAVGGAAKGIIAAGRATEAGVARMLGGGVGARIAGSAAGAGVEAAAMGVGHDVSEAALENRPLVAESMVGHGLLNFATGAALGGVLKGSGELLGRALSGTGGAKAPGMAAWAEGQANRHAFDSLGAGKADAIKADKMLGGADRIGAVVRKELPEEMGKRYGRATREELAAAAESRVKKIGSEIGDAVKRVDEEVAASRPKDIVTRVADDVPEVQLRNGAPVDAALPIPEEMGQSLYAPGRKSAADRMNPLKIRQPAEHIDAALPEGLAADIAPTKLVTTPGKAAVTGPSVQNVIDRARTEILAPLEKMPGFEGVAGPVAKYLESLETKVGSAPTSFSRFHEIRKALDDLIYRNRGPNAPLHIQELRAVRSLMEDEMTAAMEHVSPEVRAAYDAAKQRYSAMRFASDVLDKKVAAEAYANRAVSLTDTIAAGAGLASGGAIGGLVTGTANNIMRTRGSMIAADAFQTFAKLAGAERASVNLAGDVTKSVRSFLSAPLAGAVAVAELDIHKQMARVAELSGNPAKRAETFAQSVQGLQKEAPEVAQEAVATMDRGVAFLASKLPVDRSGDGSLQPLAERSAVTAEQKRKWAIYARTVDDPRTALKDLKAGRFQPEQAEALKAVYPEIYAQTQKAIVQQLAESKKKLPLAKAATLGVLLGTGGAPELQPARIQSYQRTYQQSRPAPKPSGKKVNLGKSFQTGTQRLESR